MDAQTLREKLNNTPLKIREWFGSEETTRYIQAMNKHFNFIKDEEKRVIPKMLLRLEIKDLEPRYFANELSSKLNIDRNKARVITEEIKRNIINPIKKELADYNIDLSLLGEFEVPILKNETYQSTDTIPQKEIGGSILAKPEMPPKLLDAESEITPKPIEIIGPAKPIEKISQPSVVEPSIPKEPKPVMPSEPISADKPFMIHQETEAQPVAEKKKSAMPSIGWFRKASPAAGPEKPKTLESPVKVELETFGPKIEPFGAAQSKEKKEPPVVKTEIPKQRIVHYREVETPTTFGKPFGAAQGKPGTQPPKEAQPPKIEMPAAKPIDTIQQKPAEPLKPFDKQVKPEPPKPLGAIQSNQTKAPTQNNLQNKPSNTIQNKPFGANQNRPEQPAKPAEPKVVDLDSFFGAPPKENPPKKEIELEGNIINLKNNKAKE